MISFQPQIMNREDDKAEETPAKLNLHNVSEYEEFNRNEDIMRNLRDAFLELQEVLEEDKDDLLKPIKILSP